jgi:guanylate kinase
MSHKQMKGVPFIVSAPSGAANDALQDGGCFFPGLRHSISYTTRPPRAGEVDGEDYRFIDDAEFDRMVESGEVRYTPGSTGKGTAHPERTSRPFLTKGRT